jgi:predicted NUDIX family phosphoesterase
MTMAQHAQEDDERVMVFPAAALEQLGYFQGLSTDIARYTAYLFDPAHHTFRRRAEVEFDSRLKQIIPYVVMEHEGRILTYRRGEVGGELRLLGNYSIGLGGHVREADGRDAAGDAEMRPGERAVQEALRREVAEELDLSGAHTSRLVALLNDDSNDVGKVHFGMVYLWRLSGAEVTPREQEITEVGFMTVDQLRSRSAQFESWSRICIAGLDTLLATA